MWPDNIDLRPIDLNQVFDSVKVMVGHIRAFKDIVKLDIGDDTDRAAVITQTFGQNVDSAVFDTTRSSQSTRYSRVRASSKVFRVPVISFRTLLKRATPRISV